MDKKIIFILCHTLNNDDTLDYHVEGNWSARTARDILKNTNRYKIEIWYAVNNLNKKRIFRKNNLTFALYPASTLNKLLESFFGIIKSPQIISDLKKENSKNTIIHFQGERSSLIHDILKNNPKLKYVLQYHGYGQPWWLDWIENIFLVPIEKKTFAYIDHFFVHIQSRIDYLIKKINISVDKISYQNVGVDFDNFKPRNKNQARQELQLPNNKYIILYVGRMVRSKGVDKIIKAYRILKKKYPHLYLLFIGAQEDDPLYSGAINTADRVVGNTTNESLSQYYCASDLYCFYGNKKTIRYAGVGTAPTEALACNTNVISTNLIHIPNYKENNIGFVPTNFMQFVNQTDFLIRSPEFKFNPRNHVISYTAYSYMTRNLINTYEKLFSQN